ncbi:YoaK family protein [Micromonospora sp. NPDC000316]|uniref:YoaK family protein n=1 Tax=Micromonospora sp. NPDC000316 TaxID=3364216 RepID=UPI0036B621DD
MASTGSGQPARPPSQPDPQDAYRVFRYPILALAVTTATAGFVDAFAFLRYGVFVANQSGNAIFLGIGPAGRHPAWPAALTSLVAFGAGAGVVARLRAMGPPRTSATRGLAATVIAMAVWSAVNVLLEYGRTSPQSRAVLAAFGGLAMGSLATLFVRTAGVATTITYQSGTVAKTGERIVSWIAGSGNKRSQARKGSLLGLLTLATYAVGGALGTLAQQWPLWVPVWATLVLAAMAPALRRS